MRILLLGSVAAIAGAAAISVGASGAISGSDSPWTAGIAGIDLGPEKTIQPNEAARFAKQASFGPTPELIDAIIAKKTISAWLDEQMALSESSYSDIAARAAPQDTCDGLSGSSYNICYRENFLATPVQIRFYANAINGQDQLRQRVAFALSQIIVASEVTSHTTSGLASFNQILIDNSFGNYRKILRDVTLNGYMGHYLSMADSGKDHPNENYSRELLQLFSTGPVMLNADGTPQVDHAGSTIPTYTNVDVKEISRALTGWTWAHFNNRPITDYVSRDFSKPMIMNPLRFDAGSKTFMGKTVAANATQETNVDAVVDTVFNHPNTGPYICKRLIQQLTVANPTPAYVGRVAAVFVNNGFGVRGDMKAVVRAIYLDSEARATSQLPGKVKEPVLLATSLARAIGYTSDGYAFTTRDEAMGQAPFRAPSVFNYYPYDFPLPQGDGLVSPVSKLMTAPAMTARHNLIYDWTVDGDPSRGEFQKQATIVGATGTVPNWASWEAHGADDAKTIDRINLVMLNGTMTAAQRLSVASAMAAIKNNDPALQTRKRAQVALYIVASSSLFQVDR